MFSFILSVGGYVSRHEVLLLLKFPRAFPPLSIAVVQSAFFVFQIILICFQYCRWVLIAVTGPQPCSSEDNLSEGNSYIPRPSMNYFILSDNCGWQRTFAALLDSLLILSVFLSLGLHLFSFLLQAQPLPHSACSPQSLKTWFHKWERRIQSCQNENDHTIMEKVMKYLIHA